MGWRLGLQVITGCLTSLFLVGLFYRSASLYHPQRRAILHLKDMSKKKGKDKSKIDNKPPYFDLTLLKNRPFHVILLCSAISAFGIYSPIIYLVPVALDESLEENAAFLQTLVGIGSSVGSLCYGWVATSNSYQCIVSRQFLVQSSLIGLGLSSLAFASVEGYYGYLLMCWMYGIFLGGFFLSSKVYVLELVRVRQFPRGWGFVNGVMAIPILVGIPATGYLNSHYGGTFRKSGFYLSMAFTMVGGLTLFLMKRFNPEGGPPSAHLMVYPDGRKTQLCKTDTNVTLESLSGIQGGYSQVMGGTDPPINMVTQARQMSASSSPSANTKVLAGTSREQLSSRSSKGPETDEDFNEIKVCNEDEEGDSLALENEVKAVNEDEVDQAAIVDDFVDDKSSDECDSDDSGPFETFKATSATLMARGGLEVGEIIEDNDVEEGGNIVIDHDVLAEAMRSSDPDLISCISDCTKDFCVAELMCSIGGASEGVEGLKKVLLNKISEEDEEELPRCSLEASANSKGGTIQQTTTDNEGSNILSQDI